MPKYIIFGIFLIATTEIRIYVREIKKKMGYKFQFSGTNYLLVFSITGSAAVYVKKIVFDVLGLMPILHYGLKFQCIF